MPEPHTQPPQTPWADHITMTAWTGPMIRTGSGYGGVQYWRSADRDTRGHYRYAVTPAAARP